MLVRSITFLIGMAAFQSVACQEKLNQLEYIRFHYVSEQAFPYQQLGVETVRARLFGKEVLMAKADLQESEEISVAEEVYKSSIYAHPKYELSYSVSPAPFSSKGKGSFNVLLTSISEIYKQPLCGDEFSDKLMEIVALVDSPEPPNILNVYIDKHNKHILAVNKQSWRSIYPSVDQERLIIGMGIPLEH
ncbi:hypothetical protein [Pseudoalteromonas ardens]|uniref:Uncharacterized protein n=1 Tax=Pseudoalteromonas rubra TaxID=43658 RepID=A0A0L0ERU1_9GAMM|nr:hypothetical protein [Pseudoalteromonas sp. R96]KNC67202.1 hypothetical protein AC626_12190 [Pseudoalteromonas rubra]MDK1312256.1 hypothetical protein [Pseudoalteromonas sp. R96]